MNHQPNATDPSLFSRTGLLVAQLMAYCLLAIVLMAMDHRGKYVDRIRAGAAALTIPFYSAIDWGFETSRTLRQSSRSRESLKSENKSLKETLAETQAELQDLAHLEDENRRLRTLLGASSRLRVNYTFAELVGVELDEFSHQVLINKGSDQGVFQGQPVIDAMGVIGQVEWTQAGRAMVRLISDPDHALPVEFGRTGLRSIAQGSGDSQYLVLPNVAINADVNEGDIIVTSGLGGRFPAGYPVARVMSVRREAGRTFARVYARPLAALDRGREVLLLDMEPAVDEAEQLGDAAQADNPPPATDNGEQP